MKNCDYESNFYPLMNFLNRHPIINVSDTLITVNCINLIDELIDCDNLIKNDEDFGERNHQRMIVFEELFFNGLVLVLQ